MLWAIPLPYLANTMGWVLAEVGRQPWIVYGLLRTSDAASPVAASQVTVSLIAFILVYGLLGAVGFYLMADTVRKGPVTVTEANGADIGADELNVFSQNKSQLLDLYQGVKWNYKRCGFSYGACCGLFFS
jgi:cytochrome bd-type quinol oxidase subunit 1